MTVDAQDTRVGAGASAKQPDAPLSPEDTVNLEGVEEALRSSWRAPRAVDAFPEEPEAMAPEEEFKLTAAGRRKRIGEIFGIARKYEPWHNLTPRRLRRMLEDLGPMFVKMGQILANRSEILPQEYCDELRFLRSDVEPVPFAVVNDCLMAEYGRPLSEIFSHIDRKPLGSASLAQVHRATLVTGEDVAIKVQRPGAQQVMAQDIDIMRSIVRHATRFVKTDQFIDLQGVVEELWQSFREETNFLMEARNLDDFHRFHEGVDGISCPRSYLAYCTEHIVVMDYVDGISIADPSELEKAGYSLRQVGSAIVDDYATQVLDDGFFHADPHAGNIIVKDGVVYFIDLGMVGRMSSHDRGIVKDMIYAVASGDVPKLKDSLMRFAVTRGDSSELDHSTFLSDLDFIIADFAGLDLKDLDIGEFLTSLISLARKNNVELPSVVTMFARGMVTLEGLLTEYLPDVNMVDIITDHIRHEKSSYKRAREAADSLASASYRALKGHLETAEQLGLASRMLTRGQLKINAQVLGSEQVLRHIGGIVDRLSMSIVIAGLFIGSSVVYYAKIEPVIFGIPVIGFLGYACALFLALGLGREIWRNGHGK
ncbi:MAG: lipopolysaccharide core heptose(II) kinase RfaY [Coriobacteriaceae bacterium]|nr:lipopolysaccharide core heptose(II) kinase RfaY [Coriobacteriaceae bacterium]